ncbi:MAG: peptidylprolyl isomerase [Verrucomicrobia bacterium]|nr:peptidylprolyl isomerase [Verrucomicrobiota bacterium]
MLRVDKGVPVRLVVYTIGMLYLFFDLFVFDGPLRQRIRSREIRSSEQIAAAKAQGIVARFYGQPILLTQVDRRVEERLWKEGRRLEEVPQVERKVLRMAALNDLIDLRLFGRMKVWSNQMDYPVEEAEIDAAVERFGRKFDTVEEMREGLREQGWSEEELRMRLAAKLQQDKYLAAMVDLVVSEEEAREFYEGHKEELAMPERVRVRQVFLAGLKHEAAEAEQVLGEALGRLEKKEVAFEVLAKELSEDGGSKEAGGMLGWMQAGRFCGGGVCAGGGAAAGDPDDAGVAPGGGAGAQGAGGAEFRGAAAGD